MNHSRSHLRSLVLPLAASLTTMWACSPAAPSPDTDADDGTGGDTVGSSGGSGPSGGTAGTGGSSNGTGGASESGGGGTGGVAGPSGGAAGNSGGTGSLGTGGVAEGAGGSMPLGSGCASADVFCLDFEADAAGSEPAGDWDTSVMCYDAGYSRTVQAGAGVNGSQAFVTTGASTSANTCALVHDLGALSEFWVTAHLKIGGADPDAEHEVTFFELGEFADKDDPELRIGYRGDSSCSNNGAAHQGFELGATKGVNAGEETGCTGSKVNEGMPVADTWYCVEVHVTQSGGALVADMWVDGVNQAYLLHSSPVDEIEGAFEAQFLKVGMQSYSGTFSELAIDNLSVSTTQVGCGL